MIAMAIITVFMTIIVGHMYYSPNFVHRDRDDYTPKRNPYTLVINLRNAPLKYLRTLQNMYAGKEEEKQIFEIRKERIMDERADSLRLGRERTRKRQIIAELENKNIDWHRLSLSDLEDILAKQEADENDRNIE